MCIPQGLFGVSLTQKFWWLRLSFLLKPSFRLTPNTVSNRKKNSLDKSSPTDMFTEDLF